MVDKTTLGDEVVPVIEAALVFLDSDAAFGSAHESTVKAKEQLRLAIATFFGVDADVPRLTVVHGGQQDDDV